MSEKTFTQLEEAVIKSINAQALNLSKDSGTRYDQTADCYKETLRVQFLFLAGKFDLDNALEVLKKGKALGFSM